MIRWVGLTGCLLLALLGGWVLHMHLARSGARWSIVNAMWEMA